MRSSTSKDNYEILHSIGKGSHGTVHKAINRETGEICAIKKLSIVPNDLNFYQSVMNEIKILSDCKCKNIVKFLDSACSDDEVSIVMEYCYGGSVRDVINHIKCPLTENQILVIVRDVLNGLEYLHSKQKIHFDVKAANILLTRNGIAKLGDFGVSAHVGNNRNGAITGTFLWLAPEILILDQPRKPQLDIWSLGITIIEMAETQPPYKNSFKTINEVVDMLKNPQHKSPTFKNPSKWSPGLNHLLSLCLEKVATNRSSSSQLLQHESIKKAPSNVVVAELVSRVCSNKITVPETIHGQTESLVRECLVLVNICRERREKVTQFHEMDTLLSAESRDFYERQGTLRELDMKIEVLIKRYQEYLKKRIELERERNELRIDLEYKRGRKTDITLQLEKFRILNENDEQMRGQKLMSLRAKTS